jgi:hypothetical protein
MYPNYSDSDGNQRVMTKEILKCTSNVPLNDFEFNYMKHIHERAMEMAKENGTLAGIMRYYINVMGSEMRNVLDSETPERRKIANKKLLRLICKTRQSHWNLQGFMAYVTILIEQDHADINTKSSGGKTLLYKMCQATNLSDSDQYDVIMFLLAQGADPDQGNVLHWAVNRFSQNKCSELEYLNTFNRVIQEYGGNVNYQDKGTGHTLLFSLCQRTGISDSNQCDAIMSLLANGADPDQGHVLHWVVLQFYHDKISEAEFLELLRRIVEDYNANVNYQDERMGPYMIDAVYNFFYHDNGDIQYILSNLQLWSDKFIVVVTSFLQHGGDINIQHAKESKTILSLLCGIPAHMKPQDDVSYDEHDDENHYDVVYESLQPIVCNLSTL